MSIYVFCEKAPPREAVEASGLVYSISLKLAYERHAAWVEHYSGPVLATGSSRLIPACELNTLAELPPWADKLHQAEVAVSADYSKHARCKLCGGWIVVKNITAENDKRQQKKNVAFLIDYAVGQPKYVGKVPERVDLPVGKLSSFSPGEKLTKEKLKKIQYNFTKAVEDGKAYGIADDVAESLFQCLKEEGIFANKNGDSFQAMSTTAPMRHEDKPNPFDLSAEAEIFRKKVEFVMNRHLDLTPVEIHSEKHRGVRFVMNRHLDGVEFVAILMGTVSKDVGGPFGVVPPQVIARTSMSDQKILSGEHPLKGEFAAFIEAVLGRERQVATNLQEQTLRKMHEGLPAAVSAKTVNCSRRPGTLCCANGTVHDPRICVGCPYRPQAK